MSSKKTAVMKAKWSSAASVASISPRLILYLDNFSSNVSSCVLTISPNLSWSSFVLVGTRRSNAYFTASWRGLTLENRTMAGRACGSSYGIFRLRFASGTAPSSIKNVFLSFFAEQLSGWLMTSRNFSPCSIAAKSLLTHCSSSKFLHGRGCAKIFCFRSFAR